MPIRAALIAGLVVVICFCVAIAQQEPGYSNRNVVPPAPGAPEPFASPFQLGDLGSSMWNRVENSEPVHKPVHPQEIQSQLKLLEERFKAAGLVDEAQMLWALERRVEGRHFPVLLASYREALARFDAPLILLDVQLLEIPHTDETTDMLAKLFHQAGNGSETATMPGDKNTLRTSSASCSHTELSAWIDEMARQNRVKVISKSHITLRNGLSTRITNGDTAAFPSESKAGQLNNVAASDAAPGKNVADDSQPAATTIVATASVGKGDFVKVAIIADHREVSANAGVKLRRVESTVQVKDGDSMLLSGFQTESMAAEVTRLPVLGDVPILGPRVFSRKKLTPTTKQLMFVLTPKIIRSSSVEPESAGRRIDESPVLSIGHADFNK